MSWEKYKPLVADSRDLIVIPTLSTNLSGVDGPGLDVGCGDGDLTKIIACHLNTTIFGIDLNNKLIENANKSANGNIFLVGDLTKRAISKTGVKFRFSLSNCFYNHLDSHSVRACMDDMRSSMEENARIVIIVPHWRRAEKNYKKLKRYPWGLTAIPEYGNRQYFRYGEWYCKALTDAGYLINKHETIIIPESLSNSERYGKDVGNPILSLIVAEAKHNKNEEAIAKKAFDVAHDNRKFEIDMLWKRSIFYWGFIAASFIGFCATERLNSNLSIVFSAFGFMCSVAWSAGNRGSKYWQEYWENKVVLFQNRVTGDIFIDHFPLKPSIFSQFSARRLSVSKLLMGISDYTIMVWFAILLYKLAHYSGWISGPLPGFAYSLAIGSTILYSLYVLFRSKSED
ncbi:MAG: class I SAM-dependent methyltransferase [Smithellaceae bacterium]|nr:class I SAM-dependent methyltransferase [Smithellaceae bacterium]